MKKNTFGRYELNKIYCGNCLDLFKDLPSESVDLILTDPPFAIDFKGRRSNYNRIASRVIEGYAEISQKNYLEFTNLWMREAYRVLKYSGSIYIFSGWTNLKDILITADKLNFKTLNHLIWKYQFGVYTKKRFVTSHYHILLCIKDEKKYKFNKIDHYPEDVITINKEYWTGKLKTATKLPLALVVKLIQYSSDKGDIVLDPFMGSGTVALGCKLTQRNFLGFEIVSEYVKLANMRLHNQRLLQVNSRVAEKESSDLFAEARL
jgi:site-specific DNA-methyltransferase (adenine-specific)